MCTPPKSSRASKALGVANVASRAYARRHRSMPGGNAMLCDTMARRCTAPVLLLFGMVGLAGVLSPGRAGAQAVTAVYTVSFQGQPTGSLRSTADTDGLVVADYTYRDNGRGPDLHEEARFAADGRLLDYRTSGKSTFGAPLAESFRRSDGKASWTSTADRGEAADDPTAVYVPLEGSPQMTAVLARSLLQAPQGRARAYPAGSLEVRKLAETHLLRGERSADVALYAVSGVNFYPLFVWLHSEPALRYFADMYPGYQTIEAGWEADGPRLLALQLEAEKQLLQALAERLRHPVDGLLLIRDVRVFDAEHARLTGPSDVYVRRGRIAAVLAAGSKLSDAATVVDGRGRTLLPGLFDMHGHEWTWNAMLQIAGGVTTVRDLGNQNDYLRDLIERIDGGRSVGPRIVPAGFIEGASPFSARNGFVVKSVDEANAAVDWYAQHGYRQVKLYNSMRPEWVKPVAAHAHALGLRVSGHIPAFMRAEEAVRDGYDEIQHINQVMLNFLVTPQDDTRTLRRFTLVGDTALTVDPDGPAARRFIALLRERHVAVDPTAAVFEASFLQRSGERNPSFEMIADHMPPAVARAWLFNSMDVNEGNATRYRASYEVMLKMIGRLHRAGVMLLAGTDGIAGFTLHRELELYVQAGIPPAEVLRIATWNGARLAGLAGETGSIATGKRADMILVDGDPTQRIGDIRRISLVLKEGVMMFPAEVYESIGVRRFVDPPPMQRVEVNSH